MVDDPIYKALKFCQGAVSKKDLVPGMTHFAIENGSIRAYNGVLALCHPIPVDFNCKPKAAKMVPAIANCTEGIKPVLRLTETKRLSVTSGTFHAIVDNLEEVTPHVLPEGTRMDFDGQAILDAFKVVERFIGTDASRAWQTGVLLRGQSAFATCNVVLVEYNLGAPVPATINIPSIAIREMVRIGRPPTHAQIGTHSATFHYGENCWLRTQLLETAWPELEALLNRQSLVWQLDPETKQWVMNPETEIKPGFFEGLDKIKPFCDKGGRIFFKDGTITTHPEGEIEKAGFSLEKFTAEGIYNVEMLRLLDGVATHIDFNGYPEPCLFYGNRLRGAIIGMRQVI